MKRVLVANRGEIAVRVVRALDELGLESVALYSAADSSAMHVRMATRAAYAGESAPAGGYLDAKAVVERALEYRADAIHPGYGFLSEDPAFARMCGDAGITFIGPGPRALELVSDKWGMKDIAASAGLPVLEGRGPLRSASEASRAASSLGCPVVLKAVRGGGGRGIRVARSPDEAAAEFASAAAESGFASGNRDVFAEKLVEDARHVEVQILADSAGNVVSLGDRECSVQRRHQKVVEESPAPGLGPRQREEMQAAAVRLMRAAGYANAGTVEFLLAPSGEWHFMEVNPRLQVEHPVTELVTGVDIVKWQIRIASGERVGFAPPAPRGHAIECRVCAEDPSRDLRPSPGRILIWEQPSGPGVRVDSGFSPGSVVPPEYDSLLAKVAVWGTDREEARLRMSRALGEFKIAGVQTTLDLLRAVIGHPVFAAAGADTGFLESFLKEYRPPADLLWEALAAAAVLEEIEGQRAEGVNGNGTSQFSPWKRLGRWRLGGPPR